MSILDRLRARPAAPAAPARPGNPAYDCRWQFNDPAGPFPPIPPFSPDLAAAVAAAYCAPAFQRRLIKSDAAAGWTPRYLLTAPDPAHHARWAQARMAGDPAAREIERADHEAEWAARRDRKGFAPRRLDWRAGALAAARAAFPDCDPAALASLLSDHASDFGSALFSNGEVDGALRELWGVPDEKPGTAADADQSDAPDPLDPSTWPAVYAWGMLNPEAGTAVQRWGWQSHELRKAAFAREMAAAFEPGEDAAELADLL